MSINATDLYADGPGRRREGEDSLIHFDGRLARRAHGHRPAPAFPRHERVATFDADTLMDYRSSDRDRGQLRPRIW